MVGALSHQPAEYDCPFCRVVRGEDADARYTRQADIVLQTEAITAFIAAAWWPENSGHVLVVPNAHHENIYNVPDDALAAVQIAGKRIALALKTAYGCDGTSFRQHNEPAGYQDVWHYHLHVFPRYHGDELYLRSGQKRFTTPAEREPYARKLRDELRAVET